MKNIFKIKPKFRKKELKIKLDPFEVFKRIYEEFDQAFFLESLGLKTSFARYSYLGFAPQACIKAGKGKLLVNNRVYKTKTSYQLLANSFPYFKNKEAGYTGGLMGYISYEGTEHFEFGFYLDGLIFDRIKNKVFYFTNSKQIDRSGEILKLVKKRDNCKKDFAFDFLGVNKTKNEYVQMVKQAKQEIIKGNIFQAVLSLKFLYKISGNKLRLYETLRQVNPSPYMFYF
jgi:anthranilate synthase component 1